MNEFPVSRSPNRPKGWPSEAGSRGAGQEPDRAGGRPTALPRPSPRPAVLYQEYSDVASARELRRQQREEEGPGDEAEGAEEGPGPPRANLSPSSSFRAQRSARGSTFSLWQDIPDVRGSGVLATLSLRDCKLQEVGAGSRRGGAGGAASRGGGPGARGGGAADGAGPGGWGPPTERGSRALGYRASGTAHRWRWVWDPAGKAGPQEGGAGGTVHAKGGCKDLTKWDRLLAGTGAVQQKARAAAGPRGGARGGANKASRGAESGWASPGGGESKDLWMENAWWANDRAGLGAGAGLNEALPARGAGLMGGARGSVKVFS